jgi:hypothetical protein
VPWQWQPPFGSGPRAHAPLRERPVAPRRTMLPPAPQRGATPRGPGPTGLDDASSSAVRIPFSPPLLFYRGRRPGEPQPKRSCRPAIRTENGTALRGTASPKGRCCLFLPALPATALHSQPRQSKATTSIHHYQLVAYTSWPCRAQPSYLPNQTNARETTDRFGPVSSKKD